jgi:hypothetical protein
MAESEHNDLQPVIDFICSQPGMVEEILRAHQPDSQGYCMDCGWVSRPKWPCVHYHCALQARLQRDRELGVRRIEPR